MKLYSTRNKFKFVSLKEAVLKGMPEDKGLYMPQTLPRLESEFIEGLPNKSFHEIAFEVSRRLFQGCIPEKDLLHIIEEAFTFPAPVVQVDDSTFILELFHGPSLAFKDFGARFMAKLMGYFNRSEEGKLIILVATSGDTGGAVAAGFHETPGIEVVILYPSGKVSPLQEKQLTTLGANITALEVDGTFDDCQRLVKTAFLDAELNEVLRLSSANSINIARLIPQSFYYFEAYKQVMHLNRPVVFVVPSGNFGNLTAGLFAKFMGLPVFQFVAATNINDVVPEYLEHGVFAPRPSRRTLSNAMDVGNPSNFQRMLDLYGSTWNQIRREIKGYSFTDDQTRKAMQEVHRKYAYTLDPHGAVGYLAWREYQLDEDEPLGIILETAHPAKFKEEVESILGQPLPLPPALQRLVTKTKEATPISNQFEDLKAFLFSHFDSKKQVA